ncbi:hypothetical protein TNCV_4698771 [Trichonephila clavipes]|nr:hypothetical protein TNCV_4698771 [Trichonephila clavipes]
MTTVDFLHYENPPTLAGVEPATLGADGQRKTNYATQSALAEFIYASQNLTETLSSERYYSFKLSYLMTGGFTEWKLDEFAPKKASNSQPEARAATRRGHHKMALTFGDLSRLQRSVANMQPISP